MFFLFFLSAKKSKDPESLQPFLLNKLHFSLFYRAKEVGWGEETAINNLKPEMCPVILLHLKQHPVTVVSGERSEDQDRS